MIKKETLWTRPEINATDDNSRVVSFWKQQIWDSIPDKPKSEDWNEEYTRVVSKLASDVEAVTSKEQIFDIVDYLINNGIINSVSWRLYGPTEVGAALGFDSANSIFHIPANATDTEIEANGTHFGMTRTEARLADYLFISADDPNLKVYDTDDEGNKRALFEYTSDDGRLVLVDNNNRYDDATKPATYVFYRGTLVHCSADSVEKTMEQYRKLIEVSERDTGKDGKDETWDDEAYISCMAVCELQVSNLTQDRLLDEFGFIEAVGLDKVKDKIRAVAVTNVCQDNLASILGVDDKDMSGNGKWDVDVSKEGALHTAENWFANFADRLNREDYQALVQPFLGKLKYDADGKETSLYKDYKAKNKWPMLLRGRSFEQEMMAKVFAHYVEQEAVARGIDNPYLIVSNRGEAWQYPTDRELQIRCKEACRELIDESIKHGVLHKQIDKPLEVTRKDAGIRTIAGNYFEGDTAAKAQEEAEASFQTRQRM